jgi:phosphatidylethanolamine N-methyltransferase
MADVGNGSQADGSLLRERPSAKPLHLHNSDSAKEKVLALNEQEDRDHKGNGGKRTYGRTPDGTGTYSLNSTSASSRTRHHATDDHHI